MVTDVGVEERQKYWPIMEAYFRERGLVGQHLDSFNRFIEHELQEVVNSVGRLTPKVEDYHVELGKIEVERPTIKEADGSEHPLYPNEARIRNLTYASKIYLTMIPVKKENGIVTHLEPVRIYIGDMPIMLRSKLCRLYGLSDEELIKHGEDPRDPGGYFIINGSERVLVTQEDLAPNRILIEEASKSSSYTHIAKVFSTSRGFRAPVTIERKRTGELRVSFPSVPGKIPLAILMKALGLESDKAIADVISDDEEIRDELIVTIEQSAPVNAGANEEATGTTCENALDFIGKRVAVGQTREYRLSRAEKVLDRYLLPHIGTEPEHRLQKAYYLGQMVERLIELVLGKRQADDKDHYANKRLKLTGDLLMALFRVALYSLTRDIKYQLERTAVRGRKPNIRTAVRADVITQRLKHALATGNWVGGKAGVSQLLDRTNHISSLSHLRRVVSPLSRSQPHFEARDLHSTHWGKICCSPDTNVLLGDGVAQMRLGDLEKEFENISVTTVDEKTHEEIPSGIVAYQKISARKHGKRVLKIKTETGRTISATEDHPFLTLRGWVDAAHLRLSDKVLIRPAITPLQTDTSPATSILELETFLHGTWRDVLPVEQKHLVEKDANELTRLGLLPLRTNNPKLPIIARLLGALLTNGTISNRLEFNVDSEADGVAICRDIEALGFKTDPYVVKRSDSQSKKTGKLILYQTFRTNKGGAFQRLMIALGASIGRHFEQASTFPEWILNCSLEVKREFLAAYMGGKGVAPWYYEQRENGRRRSYKIRRPTIVSHKHPRCVDKEIHFFEQLKRMLEEFKVFCDTIKTKSTERPNRTVVSLVFSTDKDNILRLCSRIGYRYCQRKQNKAQLMSEFLAYRKEQIMRGTQNSPIVVELYNQGVVPIQISQEMAVGDHVVTSTIIQQHQDQEVVSPKSSWNIVKFFRETHADKNSGMLYVPLDSIETTNEDIVCDFTTSAETHTFVANGFVTHNCPNETPEGPNCGLVKNIAMMAYISVGTDEAEVERALLDANMESIQNVRGKRGTKWADVFLNGRLVGIHPAPQVLAKTIRQKRRAGEIDNEVNITYYEETNEVQVNCDAGRVRRPLIVVENGRSRLTDEHLRMIKDGEWGFHDLLRNGIVELLDAEEEENTLIAMTPADIGPNTTHLEIVPSTILGISAALIPFPERNQSPRNVYMAGMAKQSVGVPPSNFRFRADTRSHFFHYPQIPLVKTRAMDSIGYQERPAGQNFIVAILSFEGYNIEDALIMNKASIERGLGRSTFSRVYESEERKYPGGQEDKFEIPDRSVRGYRASEAYRNLGEDGIVETEVEVQGGDVLIGRTSPPRFLEEYSEFEITTPNRRETSVAVRHGEYGIVDNVILTETIDGNRLVKVKVRDLRIPELGDKFASRHGQKGVIGYIVPQQDMPFTEDGVVPDLIINPHAIPSRMTIGQLMEMIAGKAACLEGKQQDATPFCGVTEEEIFKIMKESGFHYAGREVMYSGITGQRLATDIFIGVIYYQRLHHMVADKMHARARGPVQILTRQPTEGRAREGGLRFGEMERDVLIGHGAAILLKGRLLDESDKTTMLVCEKCGLIGVYDRNRDVNYCPICGINAPISSVVVSYAFKLLIQEMMSLGLACRLRLKEVI